MKNYTEQEKQKHLEDWKCGTLSKAAYAKSVGIQPTTFYAWSRGTDNGIKDFVEVKQKILAATQPEIVIEKGNAIIRVPMTADKNDLQTFFDVLLGVL